MLPLVIQILSLRPLNDAMSVTVRIWFDLRVCLPVNSWKLLLHSLLEIGITLAVLLELDSFLILIEKIRSIFDSCMIYDRFVVPRIVTYVPCLKSRAREMARLPASRMVCQPKWLFPNHLFLTFKCLEIKMSDLLCLCLWKRLIWKRQKEAMTGCQGDVHRIWRSFYFRRPIWTWVNDYNVRVQPNWKAHISSNRDKTWCCGEYCLFIYQKEMLHIRSLTGAWNSNLMYTRYCSFRIHWN